MCGFKGQIRNSNEYINLKTTTYISSLSSSPTISSSICYLDNNYSKTKKLGAGYTAQENKGLVKETLNIE